MCSQSWRGTAPLAQRRSAQGEAATRGLYRVLDLIALAWMINCKIYKE